MNTPGLYAAIHSAVDRVADLACSSIATIRASVETELGVTVGSLDKKLFKSLAMAALTIRNVRDAAVAERSAAVDRDSRADVERQAAEKKRSVVVDSSASDAAAASGDDSEEGLSCRGDGSPGSPEPQRAHTEEATQATVTTQKTKKKRKKEKKSKALRALGQIMRAARIGPAIFKGLPTEDDDTRAEALSVALKERGVKFQGLVPTPREIRKAERKYDLAKSLDGIDTSNIIDSSGGDGGDGGSGGGSDGEEGGGGRPKRQRRAAAKKVSYYDDPGEEAGLGLTPGGLDTKRSKPHTAPLVGGKVCAASTPASAFASSAAGAPNSGSGSGDNNEDDSGESTLGSISPSEEGTSDDGHHDEAASDSDSDWMHGMCDEHGNAPGLVKNSDEESSEGNSESSSEHSSESSSADNSVSSSGGRGLYSLSSPHFVPHACPILVSRPHTM